MKYKVAIILFVLVACKTTPADLKSDLLNEQQMLKDSATNISARIDHYQQKGVNANAETEKKQLTNVYARLIAIQSALDTLVKIK
jgi:uncharacterized protein YcfL